MLLHLMPVDHLCALAALSINNKVSDARTGMVNVVGDKDILPRIADQIAAPELPIHVFFGAQVGVVFVILVGI
jgi:hypothetical protein